MASEQARSRSAVARLLGVNRDTIGAWFALYAEGGRARLLDMYVSPGKASRVPPTVMEALVKRLDEEDGFASYSEIQTWLAEKHGVKMQYAAVYHLVAYKLNTTNMQLLIDAFAAAYPATFNVLLLDNSAVHTTERLRLPANVALVFLPPYSPELNPVERLSRTR